MKNLRYILLMLPLLLAACGYGFGDKSSVLEERYHKVAIGRITNPTTLSWIEPRMRALLRDEFTRRGLVSWEDNRKNAEAVMNVTITTFTRPTTVESGTGETLQSSTYIVLHSEIKSTTDGSTLWASGDISQDYPFFSGQEAEADMEVTRLVVRRLADKMSQNY